MMTAQPSQDSPPNKLLFRLIVNHLLQIEGGEVDDPNDRGGHTKYGISHRSYPGLNINELTLDVAAVIYFDDYWLHYRCHQLNPVAAALLFDAVVNMRPKPAIRCLQRAAGTIADGIIGPQTIAAANSADPLLLCQYALMYRARHFEAICRNDPTQLTFFNGWMRRLFALQQFILTDLLSGGTHD